MNILPKKRWHVRTKDNIARVRKDEAEAREREEKEKRRIQIAEHEAKINYLRKKNASVDLEVSEVFSSANSAESILGNLENAISGHNKEHDKEEKEIKENFEKKIGLLSSLGSASESKPWYLDPQHKSKSEKEGKHLKSHSFNDPLNDMKKFMLLKEKVVSGKEVNKKHSKKSIKSKDDNQKKSIEQLRSLRIQREKKERERAKQLLASHHHGQMNILS